MTRPRPLGFGSAPLFDAAIPDREGHRSGTVRHGGAPRLLFICTANISRSSYAELRLRQLLGQDAAWAVASAGVPGLAGRRMDARMAALAVERGVNPEEIDAFRSRPLTARMLARAGLVLTMETAHRSRILDDYPQARARVLTLAQAADAAQRLTAAEADSPDALAAALAANAPAATSQNDVPDPFRRSAAAARDSADRIDAALTHLLPLLRAT
ncbi:hypothetical protein [Actinomyces sp. MRS3W]|uniref:arsenate reductase/protein-tyrosine-phosphatase family protein n=1 Tax=Actinomyces sp. MRS3W TaxID=2800796 RepID=UPI0028FD6B72|nr:hypothetical protein [Actinomyces sp. MRS3W]MDU0348879.1 hypothetical protein [Actinomyces sp. MRS3W]